MATAETPDPDSGGMQAPGSGYVDLLAELTREYATTDDFEVAHQRVLERIRTQMNVAGASFFLLDKKDTELVCTACVGKVDITGLRMPSDAGIIGRAVQSDEVQMVADVSKDPDFYAGTDTKSGFATRSILAAPMKIHGRKLGAISVVNSTETSHDFRAMDMELLQSLASAAAMALNNANMTRELVAQERVRQEVSLAADVQRSLLPDYSKLPSNVYGLSRPAREMSGDFFDVEVLPDGRIYFALADVSGKGINAALLMVKTTSLFSLLAKSVPDPGRLLAMLNNELCANMTAGMFVTMTAGVYDPSTGRVRISNAGHMPTLIRNAKGRFRNLSAAMPPLGIISGKDDEAFPEDDVLLCTGELYLYSDGLTEGYIEEGKELGIEGFCEQLDQLEALPVRERLETIADRLQSGNRKLRDDLTLLGLETPTMQSPALPLRFRVTALPDRLGIIRDLLTHALNHYDLDKDVQSDIVLAVDEACQNIVRHAYGGSGEGEIDGHVQLHEGTLRICLADQAPKAPASACAPKTSDELEPGGLGNQFMHKIMDEVYFESPRNREEVHTGNRLIMVKTLFKGDNKAT